MAGIRWSTTFRDVPNPGVADNLWTVEIHDMDAGSDELIDFSIKEDGVIITGQSNAQDWTTTVMTTKCSVSMLITNAATQDFVDDLIGANERRFWLRVKRDAVWVFIGPILVDGIVLEDMTYPYEFKFTAVDPLSLLKDLEVNAQWASGTSIYPISRYLEELFALTGYDNFYTTTFIPFLETYVQWTNETVSDTTDDILDEVGIHYKAFNKQDGNNVRYSKAMDILQSCLQVLGARILWNFSTYTIEQFDYRAQNTTLFRHRYGIDLVQSSQGNVTYLNRTYDADTIKRRRGMTTTFLPPLKAVRVVYEHEPYSSAPLSQQAPYTPGTAVDGDDIVVLTNDDRLLLKFTVTVLNQDHYDLTARLSVIKPIIRFKVKVGTGGGAYYWKKEITGGTYSTPEYNDVEWNSSESYIEVVGQGLVSDETDRRYVGEIVSAPLSDVFSLDTSQALEVTLDSIEYLNRKAYIDRGDRVDGPNTYFSLNGLQGIQFEVFPHNGNDAQLETTQTYFNANGNANNSKVLEIPIKLGEGPTKSSKTGLWTYNGIIYKGNTEDWSDDGTPPGENICHLLAESILSLQKKPTRVIRAVFHSTNWLPAQVITMDSVKYMCLSYRMNCHKQEISGQWIELDYDNSSITKDKDAYVDPGVVVTGGGNVQNPDLNKDIGVQVGGPDYYEKFVNVTASFVTTTTADVLPDPASTSVADIRRRVEVYVGGVKRDYDVAYGYDIDYANDRVRFLGRGGSGDYENLLGTDVELRIKPF